ncbi:sulfatase-like hydrolase/transferase, partial [Helicobacter sp. 23-1045]
FIYCFVLVGDYGAMDRFILQKLNFKNPDLRVQKHLFFIATAIGSVIFVGVFLKKLGGVLKILLLTLFVLSALNAYKIATISHTPKEAKMLDTKPYQNELFSYSKTDKNIVVLVLDMFSGSHTPFILEQFPQFRAQLDGFTLFPNAISTTNSTIHSTATLIGGEYYAVYNMNKRAQNLAEQIDSAFSAIGNIFGENGFSVAMMPVVGTSAKNIANNHIFAIDASANQFHGFYIDRNRELILAIANARDSAKYTQIIQLLSFGIFRFSPELFFRPRIYNDGLWLNKGNPKVTNTLEAINFTSTFYAATHILKVDSAKATFKYFHSMMTHLPYGMYFDGEKCGFFSDKTAWDDYPHKAKMNTSKDLQPLYFQHFDTEICALQYLSHFIKSLKDAGIYDNTQIFVVSDHSGFDSINIPISSRPDALFLFKDFGASGELKVDNRLMANYDIASIFCENLPNGCPNVAPNILQNYPQNRELIHTMPKFWQLEKHKSDKWILEKAYRVRNDIYKAENWEEIKLE